MQNATSKRRIHSIDFLRGLIMAIMTVDHVRHYFFALPVSTPMILEDTSTAVFFTRWVTHFCAPVFVFLTGLGAYLHASRYELSKPALSTFLIKRGLLLIILELTVFYFVWTFTFTSKTILLQVIWAIGFSMVCLSGLIWLPRKGLLLAALAIIAGHNMLDMVALPQEGTLLHGLFAVLHYSMGLKVGDFTIYTFYPVLPWIGIMALGYLCGKWYDRNSISAETRKRYLLITGAGFILAFVFIRICNVYGDPHAFVTYDNDLVMTLLAFINVTKYPPSLLYTLITLGPALLLLAAAERWHGRLHDVIVTFGRVPFFYYVLHWYVLQLSFHLYGMSQGYKWHEVKDSPETLQALGITSIAGIWGLALILLCALYPLIAKFARLKAEKRSPILSYF